MKAVDTNILARLILQDDERQMELARDLLREPVWITHSVWLELGWVLNKRLRLDRATVAEALLTLLSLSTVHVADRTGLEWAIERYRGGADWGDVLHLVGASGASDAFVTFDRGIAAAVGDDPPVAVETLG